MKTLTKIFTMVGIILLCTECYTYVPIAKQLPPEIEVDENNHDIGFINMFDYNEVLFDNKKKIYVFQSGTREFIRGIENTFTEDEYLNLKIIDTLVKGSICPILGQALNPDTVMLLCKNSDIDYLLALEAYDIDFDKTVDVEKNSDGSKTRTAYFDLVVYAGISLYDSSGEPIDRTTIKISDFYSSRQVLSSVFTIKPALGKAGDEVNGMSYALGSHYIDKYYPTETFEYRKYYLGKDFEESGLYMKSGDWERVIDLLLPLAHSNNDKINYKAANNLAVAFEVIGEMDLSDEWYFVSDSLKALRTR